MTNRKYYFVLSIRSPFPASEELLSIVNSGEPLGLWEVDPFTVNAYFYKRNFSLDDDLRKRFPGLTLSWKKEESRDWVKEYEENLNPIKVGKRFLITPFSDADRVKDVDAGGRIPIKLVPGEAFGTGEHFTTSSTIAIMESIERFPSEVLDVGTGTGVLAIAAKHLGADKVYACDIDPIACRVARETIEMNGMNIPVFVSGPEGVSGKFGLVVANILAQTLIELSPHLDILVKNDGLLALSGITVEMGAKVKEVFSALGYKLTEALSDGEWWTLLFVKISKGKRNTAL